MPCCTEMFVAMQTCRLPVGLKVRCTVLAKQSSKVKCFKFRSETRNTTFYFSQHIHWLWTATNVLKRLFVLFLNIKEIPVQKDIQYNMYDNLNSQDLLKHWLNEHSIIPKFLKTYIGLVNKWLLFKTISCSSSVSDEFFVFLFKDDLESFQE